MTTHHDERSLKPTFRDRARALKAKGLALYRIAERLGCSQIDVERALGIYGIAGSCLPNDERRMFRPARKRSRS